MKLEFFGLIVDKGENVFVCNCKIGNELFSRSFMFLVYILFVCWECYL